jgi:hypothetical protein
MVEPVRSGERHGAGICADDRPPQRFAAEFWSVPDVDPATLGPRIV